MIRLGGRGLPHSPDDPRELARAHKAFGYRAAYCPEVNLRESDRIAGIRAAFEDEDVLIAEIGSWRNLVTPDPAERKENIVYACERLAIADEIGVRCCVTYIGTVASGSEYGPHPDNLTETGFDACVETARKIIDEVKPRRAKFALEMMQWLIPDSPEIYLKLIQAVDRPAFGAHIDPVNLILTPRQFYDNGTLIQQCFALLGPWIASAHAKDITLRGELALHFDEIRLGLGALDYSTYLTELDRHPGGIPLMLEHLPDDEYALARDAVKKVGRELGIEI
jgi:sugar phosphate isomerase/epimerase